MSCRVRALRLHVPPKLQRLETSDVPRLTRLTLGGRAVLCRLVSYAAAPSRHAQRASRRPRRQNPTPCCAAAAGSRQGQPLSRAHASLTTAIGEGDVFSWCSRHRATLRSAAVTSGYWNLKPASCRQAQNGKGRESDMASRHPRARNGVRRSGMKCRTRMRRCAGSQISHGRQPHCPRERHFTAFAAAQAPAVTHASPAALRASVKAADVKGSDSRGLGFRDSKEAGIPYQGGRGQHAPAAEHASRAAREKSQVHTRTPKSNEENAHSAPGRGRAARAGCRARRQRSGFRV